MNQRGKHRSAIKAVGSAVTDNWLCVLFLSLTPCVTLGKSFSLSEPQAHFLYKASKYSEDFIGV